MAEIQNFRSAFHGFNRKDVVSYIEYLNNTHNSELEQLRNQLQIALSKPSDAQLQQDLEQAHARIAELEAQVASMEPVPAEGMSCTEQELEAYRRAERVERVAQERAQQVSTQANSILADATSKAAAAASQLNEMAEEASAKLRSCQEAVLGTQALFADAIAALNDLHIEE